MSEPFIAQIQMWGCNFAPYGWAFCDGAYLTIAEHAALYSLIGTTYGGDGRTTMALPDLQGRVPMHAGQGPGLTSREPGERGGVEQVNLSETTMPGHSHGLFAEDADASVTTTSAGYLARGGATGRGGRFVPITTYNPSQNLQPMSASALAGTGLGEGHANCQPYQVVNFCIALTGIYPGRN